MFYVIYVWHTESFGDIDCHSAVPTYEEAIKLVNRIKSFKVRYTYICIAQEVKEENK